MKLLTHLHTDLELQLTLITVFPELQTVKIPTLTFLNILNDLWPHAGCSYISLQISGERGTPDSLQLSFLCSLWLYFWKIENSLPRLPQETLISLLVSLTLSRGLRSFCKICSESFRIFRRILGHCPRWLSRKEYACNAGDTGSTPGSGRSPGEGSGNPLQYSCLENPVDRGA